MLVEVNDDKFCKRHWEALVAVDTLLCIARRTHPDVAMLLCHPASEAANNQEKWASGDTSLEH